MDIDLDAVALFLTVGAVLISFFYFRHRTRREMLGTVRAAIERGQELSPELLESLSGEAGGQRDLRLGVIWLALACGVASLGFAVDAEPLFGVAAFPLFVGLAYLVLWWVSSRRA